MAAALSLATGITTSSNSFKCTVEQALLLRHYGSTQPETKLQVYLLGNISVLIWPLKLQVAFFFNRLLLQIMSLRLFSSEPMNGIAKLYYKKTDYKALITDSIIFFLLQ